MQFNTFSIVGRYLKTGELGVAVSSAVPAAGSLCIYIDPGCGSGIYSVLGESLFGCCSACSYA